MPLPDWESLRLFLAVARHGSLSAAARALNLSQPTLSRRIQALESGLRLQLFQRSPQGLSPTVAGQELLAAAEAMERAANDFERRVQGLSDRLEGELRLSANEIVGQYLLPPALAAFRQRHPGVALELVIANDASSLTKREADVALRMFRPRQEALTARRLPNLSLSFYAHRDYLARHGPPQRENLQDHSLIGFDRDMHLMHLDQLPLRVRAEDFALRCDSMLAQIQLLRAGAGIAATHTGLARRWPELEPVMAWLPLPDLEFWIVCHSDTRYNALIRSLTAFLAEWLSPDPYARLLPV